MIQPREDETRFERWCRKYDYDPASPKAEADWFEHEYQRRRLEQIAFGGADPEGRWWVE